MTLSGEEVSSFTLGLVFKEVVDLAGRTVVCDDGEALVVHVENQVLALATRYSLENKFGSHARSAYHDGQANKADVTAA